MLPYFQTKLPELSRLQTTWASQLNPVLSSEVLQGHLLTGVVLANGSNTVNHKLGRPLVGWFPVRVRAQVTLWDTQDANQMPAVTLILHASATVTVDLWVF